MSGFTPAASYSTGAAVAGLSDARQKPDRQWGVFIPRARTNFLSLFAQKVLDENKQLKDTKPTIKSQDTYTLTPEIFDSEAMPYNFRLTADVSSVSTGASVSLILDDASGVEVDDTVMYYDVTNPATLRVTAVSGSTLTCSVVAVSGTVTLAGSASDRYIIKLQNASTDNQTVGNGVDKELIRRTNNLQFSYKAIAQGLMQKYLALQANPSGDGVNADFMRRKEELMIDFMKQRDNMMVLAASATTSGSGTTKRTFAKGLLGFVARTASNTAADGALSYDDFQNVHMAAAFAAGGSGEVWGLAGTRVINALNSFYQKQVRITNEKNSYGVNVTRYDGAFGSLNLVKSDAMDLDATQGQMFTFDADKMKRFFLRGLDFKWVDGLQLNNVLGELGAWMVCEALMCYGDSVTLHTNILKGA